MELTERLTMQELAVLSFLIVRMEYGNLVRLGAFDVARRFGLNKRSAQRHLAGLVKAGVVEKMNPNCYKVSLEVAWRGSLSNWHQHRTDLA